MKRFISGFLLAWSVPLLLSGCSALQAWENVLGQSGIFQQPNSSSSAIVAEPSSATALSRGLSSPTAPSGTQNLPFSENGKKGDRQRPENDALAQLREEILQNGTHGAAFIGYVDYESTGEVLYDFLQASATGRKYPFLWKACLVTTEGQELYVFVPQADETIKVIPSTITETGKYVDDFSAPLFVGDPGELVMVRCNFSEIYSNVLIVISDGFGAVTFRPSLSMEDGHMAESAGLYDFSVYEDDESIEEFFWRERDLLIATDEIQQAMQQGMTLRYARKTEVIDGYLFRLFVLGTDCEDQFVGERYYGVCGNLIYVYDALSDSWAPLSAG